jgi:hypothetical protein
MTATVGKVLGLEKIFINKINRVSADNINKVNRIPWHTPPIDEQLWQGNIDSGGANKAQLTDNCFRAAGLTWAFYKLYGGMRYLYYRTSYNGFASGTLVVDMGASAIFNVYFDGTYFHIGYRLYAYGPYHIFYRRATPNADGTLTYSAGWQDTGVIPAAFPWTSFLDLAADSNHYPIVSYLGTTGLEVARCNQNDGTWTSHVVTTISSTSSFVHSWLCPMAGGDMYVVYQSSDGNLSGKLRTSGTWGSAEPIPKPTGVHAEYFWAVSNEDDEVYVVCEGLISSTPRVYFTNRVAGVWSDAEVLYIAPYAYGYGYVSLSISVDISNGNLYIFKQDAYYDANVVYKKRISGTWDADWTILLIPPSGYRYLRMTSASKIVSDHMSITSTYSSSANGTTTMMKFIDMFIGSD